MTSAAQADDAPSFRDLAAAEVRAHLARRGLSGRALAKMLQKEQTWVSRRLNGIIPMTTDDLDAIAAALGITPMDLLAGIPFQTAAAPQTSRRPANPRTEGGVQPAICL